MPWSTLAAATAIGTAAACLAVYYRRRRRSKHLDWVRELRFATFDAELLFATDLALQCGFRLGVLGVHGARGRCLRLRAANGAKGVAGISRLAGGRAGAAPL